MSPARRYHYMIAGAGFHSNAPPRSVFCKFLRVNNGAPFPYLE